MTVSIPSKARAAASVTLILAAALVTDVRRKVASLRSEEGGQIEIMENHFFFLIHEISRIIHAGWVTLGQSKESERE